MATTDKKGENNPNFKHPPLTHEQIALVEEHASVLTQKQIAHVLGIPFSYFRSKLKTQNGVLEAYKRGQATMINTMGKKLISQAENENTAAIIFYLETKGNWKKDDKKLEAFERLAKMKKDGLIDNDQLKRLGEEILNGDA